MSIPLRMRSSAALTLNKKMSNVGLSTERLSKEAGVSQINVYYLRNFATRREQVEYLISVCERLNYRDKGIVYVEAYVEPPTYSILKIHGGISSSAKKIYNHWRKTNGDSI